MSYYPFYTSKSISDTRKELTFETLERLQECNEGKFKTIDTKLIKSLISIDSSEVLEAVRIAEGVKSEPFYKCVFVVSKLTYPVFGELTRKQWETL